MPAVLALESPAARGNILASGQRLMASRGFSAVGLNEILRSAGVPKGSFYHYFGSKDAFGEALIADYFARYLAAVDEMFRRPGSTTAERLMAYFGHWQATQSSSDCEGQCLAVKLGAEVADLSDAMRAAMQEGTARIVARLAYAVEAGQADRSLSIDGDAAVVAQGLYQLWLGASVMAKIVRGPGPFDTAMSATRRILHLSAA